jgi:hypothetical protein
MSSSFMLSFDIESFDIESSDIESFDMLSFFMEPLDIESFDIVSFFMVSSAKAAGASDSPNDKVAAERIRTVCLIMAWKSPGKAFSAWQRCHPPRLRTKPSFVTRLEKELITRVCVNDSGELKAIFRGWCGCLPPMGIEVSSRCGGESRLTAGAKVDRLILGLAGGAPNDAGDDV